MFCILQNQIAFSSYDSVNSIYRFFDDSGDPKIQAADWNSTTVAGAESNVAEALAVRIEHLKARRVMLVHVFLVDFN